MPLSTPNINDVFFEGHYKYAWKETIPDGLSEAEVDFIQEMGGLNNNSKVLDLMCGYGRHAIELGRRGIQVMAIDNLEYYINEIDRVKQAENLPIHPVRSDLLTVDLQNEMYEAAICMGNSFNFFDRDNATSILKNISSHLKPNGIFILNSWSIAEIAYKHFKEKDWHYAGPYKCVLEHKFLFHPSRIQIEQTTISPGNDIELVIGIDYVFSLNEIEDMFLSAGLSTRAHYSTPRKRKFNMGDGRIYIVADKIN
jgi:SAM-dependent methyltransferase